MAIIDPVRLLQASPAENLSNLNAIDQADSLTDQSLMSFPDELMAAKKQQRDEDAASDQNNQNPTDFLLQLQNLPANSSFATPEPANIADSAAYASNLGLPGLLPGSPSLNQLEVAQSIVADEVLTAPLVEAMPAATLLGNVSGIDPVSPGTVFANAVSSAVELPVNPALDAGQFPAALVADDAVPLTPSATAVTAPVLETITASQALTDLQAKSVAPEPMAMAPVVDIEQSLVNTQAELNDKLTTLVSGPNLAGDLIDVDVRDTPVGEVNALRSQVTSLNTEIEISNAALVLNSAQEETRIRNTVSALSNQADEVVVQAGAVAKQEAGVPVENLELRTTNLNAKDIKAGAIQTPLDEFAASVINTSETAAITAAEEAGQRTLAQNTILAGRAESTAVANAAAQALRLDNAKGSELNALEAVALDSLVMKEIGLANSGEATPMTLSTTSGNSIADLGSRTMTSPFSQELRLAQSSPPLRLEPQHASLVAGPLHVEVMRVLREGGGRVILEVTPPDQGAIQLDLRLDGNGKAYLIVEGASDSTKARLEQGGEQLKEQLAQLGLSLSLDMRDRSSQSDQIPFGFNPNFARNNSRSGAEADTQLGDLMSVSRSGITTDGRVSIYA